MPVYNVKTAKDLANIPIGKGFQIKIAKFIVLASTDNYIAIASYGGTNNLDRVYDNLISLIGLGVRRAISGEGSAPQSLKTQTYLFGARNNDIFASFLASLGLTWFSSNSSVRISHDNNVPIYQSKVHLGAFLEYLFLYHNLPSQSESIKDENGKTIILLGDYKVEIKQGTKYEFI